jgi:hypothetical protein
MNCCKVKRLLAATLPICCISSAMWNVSVKCNASQNRSIGIIYERDTSGIRSYSIGADGRLSPRHAIQATGVCNIYTGASGKYLYAYATHPDHNPLNQFLYSYTDIYVYRIGENEIDRSLGLVRLHAEVSSLCVDPKGRFLFAFAAHGVVVTYRILSNGSIRKVKVST